ncbi:hypothetical protein [Streptomyces sp. NPDC058644]|uniref:hypothetical protein n=1 Tax=unclassified Streptomyces TaxID=2593676 RepID=UPI0036675E52
MTTTDNLLERLVKRVNETGELLDVTLMVRGATITGKLAPRGKYLSTIVEELHKRGLEGYAEDFAAEGHALDTEEYLHLSGGQVLFGSKPLPEKGGLARIPLHAVDGWWLGRVA